MDQLSPRRFLTIAAATAVLAAATSVALVVVADPYRLYGLVERSGFNERKPQPERYQKQIKLAAARRLQARLLIVGNSRAEIGFDPAYPGLTATHLTPYNLSLAGTRLEVAREQLDELAATGQLPNRLLVGVEFLDFPVDPSTAQLPVPVVPRGMLARVGWQADALFSLDSVVDAIRTLSMQRAAHPASMTSRGFNPLLEYRELARKEGQYALFRQRADDYAKRLARMPHGLVSNAGGSSKEFDQFDALIVRALEGEATIDVVIYPYHAQLMALFEAAGMGDLFDHWKTMLVARLERLRVAHPAARITLWDFSGYSPYQCEAIPASGDYRSVTRWYWEAGHFKGELGNIMLAQILAAPGPAPEGSFGFQLTPATLAGNRQRIMDEQASCRAGSPRMFAEAAALLSTVKPR